MAREIAVDGMNPLGAPTARVKLLELARVERSLPAKSRLKRSGVL